MGYFYSAPESVLGTVPTLIAQFEVLPETEVLRTPGGQKREHRARERKTGDVFANCQPPGLYKDHHTPTHFSGFPSTNLQPHPHFCSIFRPMSSGPSDPEIRRPGSHLASTLSSLSPARATKR